MGIETILCAGQAVFLSVVASVVVIAAIATIIKMYKFVTSTTAAIVDRWLPSWPLLGEEEWTKACDCNVIIIIAVSDPIIIPDPWS